MDEFIAGRDGHVPVICDWADVVQPTLAAVVRVQRLARNPIHTVFRDMRTGDTDAHLVTNGSQPQNDFRQLIALRFHALDHPGVEIWRLNQCNLGDHAHDKDLARFNDRAGKRPGVRRGEGQTLPKKRKNNGEK